MKKKTIIKISKTLLEDLLHIPANIKIENVSIDRFKNDEIMILLEGEGLPDSVKVEPGEIISCSK